MVLKKISLTVTKHFLEDFNITDWPFWMVENKNAKLEMTCPKFLIINQEPVRHHHWPINQPINFYKIRLHNVFITNSVNLISLKCSNFLRKGNKNMSHKVVAGDHGTVTAAGALSSHSVTELIGQMCFRMNFNDLFTWHLRLITKHCFKYMLESKAGRLRILKVIKGRKP